MFYKLLRKRWIIKLNSLLNNEELNYINEGNFIQPNEIGKLWFISDKKVKKGWYLFGILHFGDNKKCISRIYSKHTFMQSRPTFPSRRRWRIIRQKDKENIIIEINQINSSININEIWLIKIPSIFAWFKIKKRIQELTSFQYSLKIKKKYLWKKYNNLFDKQIKKNKQLNYEDWLHFTEKRLVKNLKLKYKDKKCNFIIYSVNNIKSKCNYDWIILTRENIVITKVIDYVINFINTNKNHIDIAYGDEDHISENLIRFQPIFKPAWNKDIFWADPFFTSHWIISRKFWCELIKNDSKIINLNFEEISFSLIKNIVQNKKENYVKHIPFIISSRKLQFYDFYSKGKRSKYKEILFKHIQEVSINEFNSLDIDEAKDINISWSEPKDNFLSIIIPTRDKSYLLENCINSIKKFNPGCKHEIIIVDNNSEEDKTKNFLNQFLFEHKDKHIHRVLKYDSEFNFSKINNYAVKNSKGNEILLLNNDVEFLSENWGVYLTSNANREDIGCVGAKLLFEDYTIQHAGVVLGIGGVAGHSHKYFNNNSSGYCRRLELAQEYSAVTAACLCITKEKWNLIGGLDEENLKVNYNDVDFCMRANKLNLRNIYLPKVIAFHHESKSRGKPIGLNFKKWKKEYRFMQKKWGKSLQSDRFYNPHLSLQEENWSYSIKKINLIIR